MKTSLSFNNHKQIKANLSELLLNNPEILFIGLENLQYTSISQTKPNTYHQKQYSTN